MDRSRWKLVAAFLIVGAFAFAEVLYACKINQIYNARNLTQGDSTYMYSFAGNALYAAKTQGLWTAFTKAFSFGTYTSLLHWGLAILLAPFLKVSYAMGPILNGIWFFAMAVSLTAFFWNRTRAFSLTVLLPIPVLICGELLAETYQGLADFHVNLLGFTLSTCVYCWVLISDRLRKMLPAAIAGIFVGLLILGRVFSLALVVAALAPYVFKGLFSGAKEERRKSLRGLQVVIVSALVVSGWWLVTKLELLLNWPFKYCIGMPGAQIWILSPFDSAKIFARVAWKFFFYRRTYYILSGLLLLIPVYQMFALRGSLRERIRQFSWETLWMGIAPFLVLIGMACDYPFYSWPAFFGVYLTAVFPFKPIVDASSPLRHSFFRMLLAVAILASTFGFLKEFHRMHAGDLGVRKENAVKVADVILEDVRRSAKPEREVKVSLAYYGKLAQGPLANVFLYDRGVVAIMPGHQIDFGSKSPAGYPIISMPQELTQVNLSWRLGLTNLERQYNAILDQADYVIVLAPEVWGKTPPFYPEVWPSWEELSRLVLKSGRFEALTQPLEIGQSESVIVMKRKGL